eukprot:3630207-Amphidinium_carterae.2
MAPCAATAPSRPQSSRQACFARQANRQSPALLGLYTTALLDLLPANRMRRHHRAGRIPPAASLCRSSDRGMGRREPSGVR